MGDPGPTINGAQTQNWVRVLERPVFAPQKLRVVCIGAGFAGLIMAHKHKHENASEFIDLTIYEKNAGVGGTWFENRYPGISCDVPAQIYTFPFEPNPNWSTFYAGGPEILEYIQKTTKKYGLDENIQFNSKIISTIWNDATGKWDIKILQDGTVLEDTADVLVNGAGILNNWRWPSIKGLDSFKGTLLHSADWDLSVDWAGKRVALIGNGSSGIQLLPQIQPEAAHVTTYIRHPTWISTPYGAQFTPEGKNFAYTEEEKEEFRADPEKFFKYRHEIEATLNGFFTALQKDSPLQGMLRQMFEKQMGDRLGNDKALCEKLIPEWDVGCRRLTPGDGYLEALREKNVKIESGHIEEVTPMGIKTNGRVEEFDMIVCATGFDISFCPAWEMVGKDGSRLADQWRESPEAYFGICAPNMPNYFIFNGPNCPIGHGSLFAVMDWTANWIVRWCRKIAAEDIKSVRVSNSACDDHNVYSQEFLKRMVWSSGCKSWYKNGKVDGPVTAMYAGSVLHYKEILESFRAEDFVFEYKSGNKFRFMGNGLTVGESNGEDMAYYLK